MSDSSQPHELYRPPGSSVHGILQTRILEWVAISFSRGSSQPRDWTGVACIAGRLFTIWATREDSVLKSRYITLLTEVQLVKAMVFPVVMYWYESWTVKQVWALRTDALELWFWKRLLRLPWTARRSNQSILREINPEYSLEELMLKLQFFGHLMQQPTHWKGKDPVVGRDWRQEEKGWQKMRELKSITNSMDKSAQSPGDSEGQRSLVCYSPWATKSQIQLSYWTTTTHVHTWTKKQSLQEKS